MDRVGAKAPVRFLYKASRLGVLPQFVLSVQTGEVQKVRVLSIFGDYLFVILLFVVFRAKDLSTACAVFAGLFCTTGICYINVFVVVYLLLMSNVSIPREIAHLNRSN